MVSTVLVQGRSFPPLSSSHACWCCCKLDRKNNSWGETSSCQFTALWSDGKCCLCVSSRRLHCCPAVLECWLWLTGIWCYKLWWVSFHSGDKLHLLRIYSMSIHQTFICVFVWPICQHRGKGAVLQPATRGRTAVLTSLKGVFNNVCLGTFGLGFLSRWVVVRFYLMKNSLFSPGFRLFQHFPGFCQ